MVNYKFKKAFSMAEILVSMLILSIFFVVSSKTITIKQKNESMRKVHGYFECYYKNGSLYYAKSKTGERVSLKKAGGSTCPFIPASNSSLFQITVLFPNEGNYNTYDDQQFINTSSIKVVPPSGAGAAAKIGDVSVLPNDNNINDNVNYQVVKNNLEITNSKSNIIQDLQSGSVGGAVVISW